MPIGVVAVVMVLGASGVAALRSRPESPAGPGSSASPTLPLSPSGPFAIIETLLRPANLSVEGTVVDAETDQLLPGAIVTVAQSVTAAADGRFQLTALRSSDQLTVAAPGYVPVALFVGEGGAIRPALTPRVLNVTVTDAYSGGPVEATVRLGDRAVGANAAGAAQVRAAVLPGEIVVSAPEYAPVTRPLGAAETELAVQLRPNVLRGQVRDGHSQQPIGGVQLQIAGRPVTTDHWGNYRVEDVPEEVTIEAFARGYHRAHLTASRTPLFDIPLEPQIVKGVYLSYFAVGSDELRQGVIDLIKRTELNAVVIDVKGDRAKLLFGTDIPLAKEIGAQDGVIVEDIDAFLKELHANNIYVIARIVTFKDNLLAQGRPDWAIQDERTGKPWIDDEGLAWADPFRTEVWDYNTAIAVTAARHGFDEVQFDYIRFPTDGKVGAAQTSQPNTQENRVAAIAGFLKHVRAALKDYPVAMSIDTFGYTTMRDDDMGIGQLIEEIAPHVDVICPMVYPSTFLNGIPGLPNPVAQPYDLILKTTQSAIKRVGATGTRIRPWLQDFPDYAFDQRAYGVKEVKAQIEAANDAGAPGWLLWDPRNRYTAGALAPKR